MNASILFYSHEREREFDLGVVMLIRSGSAHHALLLLLAGFVSFAVAAENVHSRSSL